VALQADDASRAATLSLLDMRLTESIHHSGRVVIIGIDVRVLRVLVKLASVCAYASAVTKWTVLATLH
jgi:hypothetical protein